MLTLSITDPELVRLLNAGGVGVLPTDTLYGLVCRAEDPEAVARLYALKHRESKPGTVIAANVNQLKALGLVDESLMRATSYWPGPLSILITATEQSSYITQGLPELACRVISGPTRLITLLEQIGPLLTSSANQPGEPVADTIDQAISYFGDSIDFYVDAGDYSNALPSTLVRLGTKGPEVLRQGAGRIHTKEVT